MSWRFYARLCVALVAGAMFGFGLSLSGMLDPARVVGFLDVGSGHWDPSLIFVLGGAVVVAIPGVLLVHRLNKPLFDDRFYLPEKTAIDKRLIVGSAIFGIGWGLAGFCPGPALSAIATGQPLVFVFIVSMVVGMTLHDRFLIRRLSK